MAIFERSEKEPVKYAFIYLTFLLILLILVSRIKEKNKLGKASKCYGFVNIV